MNEEVIRKYRHKELSGRMATRKSFTPQTGVTFFFALFPSLPLFPDVAFSREHSFDLENLFLKELWLFLHVELIPSVGGFGS